MKWLRKLGAGLLVARVTQRRLRVLQQALTKPPLFNRQLRHLKELRLREWRPSRRRGVRRFDQMGRMARLARHGGGSMARMIEFVQLRGSRMARQTARGVFRRCSLERKNEPVGCGT